MKSVKTETQMTVEGVTLDLRRIPHHRSSPLRAWDAADQYVLDHLAASAEGFDRILVVNDLFGALAASLVARYADEGAPSVIQSWGDSITSHAATNQNLERNGLDPRAVALVPSTQDPFGLVDLVVLKIPRSLALLEEQLIRLRPMLHPEATIVAAGMVKSIHRSTLELFERLIGPAPTSKAVRKARLIHPTVDRALPVGSNPFPSNYDYAPGLPLTEHANVFARGRVDVGTRLLLEHLPVSGPDDHILDLGCGNGLLGLESARRHHPRLVTFVDESYHAVDSARLNHHAWALENDARFEVARTLDPVDTASVDLVLNNPPFHSHQSRSDDTARLMFADAHRVLRPGGRLVVVANRHLDHHRHLRRRFAAVRVVASNPKFVVREAVR